MYLISAEVYADVHVLKVRKTGEIWVNIKVVDDGLESIAFFI